MLNDFRGPSLDTTIFGIVNTIWLFARHPDQWQLLRDDHSLLPHAINESLRLESPIQAFSRTATTDHDVDGITVPAGTRVVASSRLRTVTSGSGRTPSVSTFDASLPTSSRSVGVPTSALGCRSRGSSCERC